MLERHVLLEATSGTLDIENESLKTSQLFSWLFFVMIIVVTIIQITSFFIYNGPYHPFAKILKGTNDNDKGNIRKFLLFNAGYFENMYKDIEILQFHFSLFSLL